MIIICNICIKFIKNLKYFQKCKLLKIKEVSKFASGDRNLKLSHKLLVICKIHINLIN